MEVRCFTGEASASEIWTTSGGGGFRRFSPLVIWSQGMSILGAINTLEEDEIVITFSFLCPSLMMMVLPTCKQFASVFNERVGVLVD